MGRMSERSAFKRNERERTARQEQTDREEAEKRAVAQERADRAREKLTVVER